MSISTIDPEIELPELLEKLAQIQVHRWETVCRTMKTRDLRLFSQELQQLATAYQCTLLQEYSKSLATQIELFDWENLPNTLERFPKLVQHLRQEINLGSMGEEENH